jgi:hypothetical protein
VPARELPLQRFKFTARLMRAAGYRGWVILIDEVELIGRYSRLQRARSYSELARWMGRVEIDQYPGLTSVGAITDDFVPEVLEKKGDLDYVSPQLQARDTPDTVRLRVALRLACELSNVNQFLSNGPTAPRSTRPTRH